MPLPAGERQSGRTLGPACVLDLTRTKQTARRIEMENYVIAMGVSAGIYALMALGLNVIWGMAGLVNLGLVGFFAVGAYVSALLTRKLGLPLPPGLICGRPAA